MVNSVNANPALQRLAITDFSADFQAKAARFKEITGREVEILVNENGDKITAFHPESTAQASFFVEFFRVGFSSPDGHMAAVENLARRYAELREGLLEKYQDDQDTLYKRLGELNQTFENALHSTVLLPLQSPPSVAIISSNMPRSTQSAIKREWQEHENVNSFMQTAKQNMTRHLDTFFETFIKSIQSNDFDSAFAGSMEGLNNGESRSLSDMSFRDTVAIFDALRQGRVEQGEHDNEVFIFNRPINSIRAITADTSISETIRRELAELMGFTWRN